MLKKVLPLTFILILVGVMIVQAVEKEQSKKEIVKSVTKNQSSVTNEQLENLYNNVMSSQLEEEPDEEIPEGFEIGTKAPEFELKDLNGKSIHLSDYKGKKVLINFFATWCHPCRAEMPILESFYKKDKSIKIIAINVDTKSDVNGFVNKIGITFPVLLDEKDIVNSLYQIQAIPTTYLVDEKGIIVNKHIGSLSKDGLVSLINYGKK